MARVKLLRPLDGANIGDIVEYADEDARYLEDLGVVKIQGKSAAPTENKMEPAVENKSAKK